MGAEAGLATVRHVVETRQLVNIEMFNREYLATAEKPATER